jgi:type VI secretion system protein ImpA
MSARWQRQDLLPPITPDRPCGENLEDTPLLASFDAFRLFGQAKPLDAPPDPGEKRIPKPPGSPEWSEIRDQALAALAKSKDLRLLVHLGTALLRTDGVAAFSETLAIASDWLETYWGQLYPLVDADDKDAIRRKNALSCFADPMAVVDAIRRVPLVSSRQHGTFSLRDVDIATHQQAPGGKDAEVDENRVNAAFASMPGAELTRLHESVVSAVASLKKIDATMSEAAGPDAPPNFDALTAQLARMNQVLRAQLSLHPATEGTMASGVEGAAASPGGEWASASGVVTSRQDAIRALDAVADFFRRTEPSSPIPMFLERAKRLVSKDFLEVLADIAPDAVAQARAAGGLKD